MSINESVQLRDVPKRVHVKRTEDSGRPRTKRQIAEPRDPMMSTEGDRTSLIERQSVTSDISKVASYLQEHLGQKVTAYLSGVKDAKLVGQWAAGKVQPRPMPKHRLRSAYQAARYLVDAYDSETAQAWFFGRNSQLAGRAPAFALREGKDPEDWSFVVTAAKTFVETVP